MRRNPLPGQEDKWWRKTITPSSARKEGGAEACVPALVHKLPLPKGRALLYSERPAPAGVRNSGQARLVGDAELVALSALASHDALKKNSW